jgi:peptidoglycan/LPS O-acetylase OafA/YrhL
MGTPRHRHAKRHRRSPIGTPRHRHAKRNRGNWWLGSRSIGDSFDPRNNSLNFLRLVFALLVIASHCIPLGGFGSETIIGKATLGDISVDGFFGISGFLVARSAASSKSIGRYSWHRFLRIFPGLWVCLVVIAFVIAPLAFIHQNPGVGLGHFFASSSGPFAYLGANFSVTQLLAFNPHTILISSMSSIAGTPDKVPFPGSWAGSLWSVQWELLCYALLALFAIFGGLRHRLVVLTFFLAVWALNWTDYLSPGSLFHVTFNWAATLRLVPIFFLGVVMYLFAHSIPDSPVLALLCAGLLAYGLNMSDPYDSNVMFGPVLVYLVVWLGIHLNLTRFGQRNDLSFGVYIYGFAVQELLAVWGVYRWGFVPYLGLSMGISLALAAVSWKLVESRAMRLKHWSPSLGSHGSEVVVRGVDVAVE